MVCTTDGLVVGSHPHTSVLVVWSLTIISIGVANVIELRENASEDDKGSPCSEDTLPQGLTRMTFTKDIFGMVGIPHRTRQQAHFSN